jgi:hypothetical protein
MQTTKEINCTRNTTSKMHQSTRVDSHPPRQMLPSFEGAPDVGVYRVVRQGIELPNRSNRVCHFLDCYKHPPQDTFTQRLRG